MDKKPVSKWVGASGMDPKTLWRSKPIPLRMLVCGYLPTWLGGEMVYDAVVRTNHFQSDSLLMSYLMEQAITAAARGEEFHAKAIAGHMQRLRQSARRLKFGNPDFPVDGTR